MLFLKIKSGLFIIRLFFPTGNPCRHRRRRRGVKGKQVSVVGRDARGEEGKGNKIAVGCAKMRAGHLSHSLVLLPPV
jgi:hypothetical protein